MSYTQKKHCGYWLKRSFFSLQGKDFNKGFFLGIHKLRNIKNIQDPIEEDYQPKTSIVFLNNYMQFEAVLFPSSETAKLLSAINVLYIDQDLLAKAQQSAEDIFNDPDSTSIYEHYIVKDLHTVTLQKVYEASYQIGMSVEDIQSIIDQVEDQKANCFQKQQEFRIGNYYSKPLLTDPDNRPNDIQWLRESCIFIKRKLSNKTFVQQLIVVGKDMRYNVPVIGMRKVWDKNNFYTIFPLVDDLPLQFLTNFYFLALHKPHEAPFEPVKEFEKKIQQWGFFYNNNLHYISVDIIKPPIADVINMIRI